MFYKTHSRFTKAIKVCLTMTLLGNLLCDKIKSKERVQKCGDMIVRFSPAGDTFVTCVENTVYVWDTNMLEIIQTIQDHKKEINIVRFWTMGNYFGSICGREFFVYERKKGLFVKQLCKRIAPHHNIYNVFAVSPNETLLAATDYQNFTTTTVIFFDNTHSFASSFVKTVCVNFLVWTIEFSPNSKQVALAGENMRIYNIEDGFQLVSKPWQVFGKFQNIKYSPDGKILACIAFNQVQLWCTTNIKLIAKLTANNRRVNDISFSPDSSIIACSATDDFVRLWNVKTKKQVVFVKSLSCCSVSFSPDGDQLLIGKTNGHLDIYYNLLSKSQLTLQRYMRACLKSPHLSYESIVLVFKNILKMKKLCALTRDQNIFKFIRICKSSLIKN